MNGGTLYEVTVKKKNTNGAVDQRINDLDLDKDD